MKQLVYRALYKRAILTWLLFIPLVILNGAVREAVYKPVAGELAAHQISTVIATAAFLALAYFRLRSQLSTVPKHILYRIGLAWVAFTVLFEIGLGRFILDASWEKLFWDYNLLAGRVWSLFLLVVFFTPVVVKQILFFKKTTKIQYSK